jgi:integrase
LASFRTGWAEKWVNTKNKKLDRLKAFFGFCHDAGMVLKNPASHIKPATAPRVRVQPFSAEEQGKILSKPQTNRIRAFVHTLYHSGLRISDACFLKPADFDGNCIRRVNRKNDTEIYVPLPPYLKADLDEITLSGGYYFLIGESENLHTQTDAWRTILNDLFKTDIHGFDPHRFRHTRVVEWLAHGITLEEISGMIGTSIKILEKHYASFAPARQQVVSEKLNQLWSAKPKLVRVK